jgi:long-chain acyl-CoA synthetase
LKSKNLVEMLSNTVERYGAKDALLWKVDGTYQKLTYQAFWQRIHYAASGFAKLGVKKDDKVAILSNSNPMWGITDFAVASLGAVSVPIYPTLPPEQVHYILNNADVVIAVVENEYQLNKVTSQSSEMLKYTIVMNPSDSFQPSETIFSFEKLEMLGKENLLENWEEIWRSIPSDQLVTIIHTSGTTGNPKGVMLTHGNFLANIEAIQFWLIELLPDDVALSYLPLSHVFERLAGHYMQFSIGTTVAYAENLDTIADNLLEIKPTVMTTVPRLLEKVYVKVREEIDNGPSFKKKIFNWAVEIGKQRYDMYVNAPAHKLVLQEGMPKEFKKKWERANRLVYKKVKDKLGGRLRGLVSGGGTLNPELARFFWALDIPILEGYGLTETSPVVTTNPMIRAKVGTVGKVLPNLEVKIAPDGEVLVRGPSVMKGYYKNEEATNEVFDGDWFKTGDIGQLDDENYLKIIDRKKRILVLSTGKNVAPQPIESVINESAYIEHSIVVGDNRKYVSCLVHPEQENLLPWAEEQGLNTSDISSLYEHPKVISLIEGEVRRLTKSFADFEIPKKVVIIKDKWTIEGGELSPKLSIRPKIIENKYKELIDSIYEEKYVEQAEAVATTE